MLICDLSIPKCNYLNGSDHAVTASYSGLHEECEVSISTSHPFHTCWYVDGLEAELPWTVYTLLSNQRQWLASKWRIGVNTWRYLYMAVVVTSLPFMNPKKACWKKEKLGYTLICSPHISHEIQNSWQSLRDLSHSGNYILECSDHISTWCL